MTDLENWPGPSPLTFSAKNPARSADWGNNGSYQGAASLTADVGWPGSPMAANRSLQQQSHWPVSAMPSGADRPR